MRRFHIEFIGRKWLWFSISGAIIVVGLLSIMLGGLKWGVEFQGGNQFDVKFKKAPTITEIRKVLTNMKLANNTIQPVGSGNEYLVRTPRLSVDTRVEVQKALKKNFPVTDISARDIGPGWGKQVTDGAIKALIASLFILLLYISVRFEFKMAVAALVALVHDALIVVGVYATLGLIEAKLGAAWIPSEVTPNTVAALLTILGFSLYDTIVVFHRIRENTELIGKRTYSRMANDSINQVLMRSINTSLTALIPVFVLLMFGGSTLRDFAFAMFVGLISGAYSSIFIASPILAMWKEIEPRYRLIRERIAATPQPKISAAPQNQGKGTTTTSTQQFKSEMSNTSSSPTQGEGMGAGAETAEPVMPATPKPPLTAAQKAKKKKKKKRR